MNSVIVGKFRIVLTVFFFIYPGEKGTTLSIE
jgi:hypothetical protein